MLVLALCLVTSVVKCAGIAPYVSSVANGYSDIYVVRTTYMSVYSITLGYYVALPPKGLGFLFLSSLIAVFIPIDKVCLISPLYVYKVIELPPQTRPVNTGVIFDSRVHGPCW